MKIKSVLKTLLTTSLFAMTVFFSSCDIQFAEVKEAGDLLKVHFIDVGQADSIFIQLPDDTTMLIDAGEKSSGETVTEYITEQGCNKIDYLVATHPHADHIGGMSQIVENFEIGSIYMPDVDTNTKTYENLLETIAEKNLKIKSAKSESYIIDSPDLTVKILAPVTIDEDELNNCSVVLRMVYDDTTFLFTGDAEMQELEQIKGDISADVLKVGHHGSSTSTDEDFLSKVYPSVAVISCGKDNDYGHPHDEVLDYLADYETEVYRTDEDGNVTVTSDGRNIVVTTENEQGGYYD